MLMIRKLKFLFLLLLFFSLTGCINNEEDPNNEENKELQEKLKEKDMIFLWLEDCYKGITINGDMDFPKKHPDSDLEISFYSFEEEYLDNNGKFNAPIIDYDTEILFTINIDGKDYELFVPVTFKGYGDAFDLIVKKINEDVPNIIETSINLPTSYPEYNCKIEWTSDDEKIITNQGAINKDPFNEQYAILWYKITYKNEVKENYKFVTIPKMTDLEKINLTKKWLDEEVSKIGVIDKDIELPRRYEEYKAYLVWHSWNPTAVSDKGKYNAPFNDEEVILEARISVGIKWINYRYNFKVKGENNTDIWKKIESFLERINIKEIKNQKFYLFGCEPGYERVPTENIGYLPFYDEKEMEIKVDLLPDNSPLKPNKKRTVTKYIVIHNTGMAASTATAKGLNDYIHTTDRIASWHFSIDDKETYQELDLDEVGWHAGDGSYTYKDTWAGGIGGGNLNGIGIESCVYQGVDFNKVLRRLAKLTAMLLIKYDLDMQCIKQHYDFSSKDCPQVIRHSERWNELLDMVRLEYFAQTELKGVSFEWISLNPDIMDNGGTIINHPGDETKVKYKVIVTYNGVSKEYEYESLLLEYKK